MTRPPLPDGKVRDEGIQQSNLHGLGVLITRPQHQAQPLYDAIRRHGGKPVLFPTVEITAPPDPAQCKQQLEAAAKYDDLIFISPNAVNYAVADLAIDHQRIFAIGGATARMLQQHHIRHHLPTGDNTDSENLLASPLLSNMRGRKMLIIRGNGGRSLLGDTLRKRGASVDYAAVYERRRPDVDASPLLQTWAEKINVIIATSNAIIDNLLNLCRNAPVVLRTPLVVISQRMQKHALKCGFHKVIVAQGTATSELIEVLCHLDQIH